MNSRTKLYQELDKIFLRLIAHPATKYDEDASLKEIHTHLMKLANLKSKEIQESQVTDSGSAYEMALKDYRAGQNLTEGGIQ